MKGMILAAGKGLRLHGATGGTPKCLIEIGGHTLLERQIRALRSVGVEDITVVVGYQSGRVRRACDARVTFVENERFEQTNSLYSLWLARDLLVDGFLVINSDVLFHPQLLSDLMTARYEDALLISYCDPRSAPMGDEEMKVKVSGGRVTDISKTMDPTAADGENVGIVKFGRRGAGLLVEQMDALIASGCQRDWAPRAFCEFAKRRPLYAVDTRGYPWIEIDFPEDFQRAVQETLPKIAAPLGEETLVSPVAARPPAWPVTI